MLALQTSRKDKAKSLKVLDQPYGYPLDADPESGSMGYIKLVIALGGCKQPILIRLGDP